MQLQQVLLLLLQLSELLQDLVTLNSQPSQLGVLMVSIDDRHSTANLMELGSKRLLLLPHRLHLRPHVCPTLTHLSLEVSNLLLQPDKLMVVALQLCHPLFVLCQKLVVSSPLVRGGVPVLGDVGLELLPEPVHHLLHRILHRCQLLQVPVPDLILSPLKFSSQCALHLKI